MYMDLGDATIHQYITIHEDSSFTFYNGIEEIRTVPASSLRDSMYLEMPIYHTYFALECGNIDSLQGYFANPDRGSDYRIPCTFNRVDEHPSYADVSALEPMKYEVQFSPDTEDEYPAICKYNAADGLGVGTFETETGDYRYLYGNATETSTSLQCFDGSHAFHFDFEINNDSITGTFLSGTHWSEPFKGTLNPEVKLRDPYSITTWNTGDPIDFHAMDTNGEMHHFDQSSFEGKVSILQLTATWCPNCLDASKFYRELIGKEGYENLQIIPVAFERSKDYQTNAMRVKSYQEELGLDYPMYIGGRASKQVAHELFPSLNDVSSFPTSLFINQKGEVVRIYTGFYGPGTGMPYENYKSSTEVLLDSLINVPA